jgi:hypothetical protein
MNLDSLESRLTNFLRRVAMLGRSEAYKDASTKVYCNTFTLYFLFLHIFYFPVWFVSRHCCWETSILAFSMDIT